MKFFYLLLLSILPSIAFSQADYTPGYIVKTSKDTVRGYISYPKQEETALYIRFKADLASGEVQTYAPAQLIAFQITGKEKYLSYHGRISMDKNKFPNIATSRDTTTLQGIFFLRSIYLGKKVSLFLQSDKMKVRYFTVEGNDVPQELIYYYYFDADQNLDHQLPVYKGQLLTTAHRYNKDDPRLVKKLKDVAFEEDQLKQIVTLIDKDKIAK